MTRSNRSKRNRVTKQAMQIATLAPVVASARLARVASTGDYNAFAAMGNEKAVVFTATTVGLMFAGVAAFAKTAFAISNAWSPWGGTARQRVARLQSSLNDASLDVVRGALAPTRKRVVANSRKLGR
jgi:hypothetical protein